MKVRLQLGLTQEVKYLPGDKGWVVRRASCPALQTCPVRPAVPSKIMGLALRGKHFCCHHNGSSPTQAMLLERERGRIKYEKLESRNTGQLPLACRQLPECHAIGVMQVARPCMGLLPLQAPHPLQNISNKAQKKQPRGRGLLSRLRP